MTVEQLQEWLERHMQMIAMFMDYDAVIRPTEEFATTLDYWIGHDNWRSSGHEFAPLGADGTGSQIAAWLRPDEEGEPPVVLFGSEGGRGVLARSPKAWALILAYAPPIPSPGIAASTGDCPPTLNPDANHIFGGLREISAPAEDALENYRAAASERFGTIPPIDVLAADRKELHREFVDWVDAVLESD